MEEKCMVSILCTAYNHEKYIRQTLESFLAQKTDFKYEILVHDDASTDGTADIIRGLTAEYPDVIFPILQTENQYSKNVLITNDILVPKAKGKYIALCEGDDYWSDPDKLQMQVDWLESNPEYSACVHNTVLLNCENGLETPYNTDYTGDRDMVLEDVIYGVGKAYHTSAIVARLEYFTDMPDFYCISMSHHVGDHPRAIWFAINGKIRYINKLMSVYRCFSAPTSWSLRMRESRFVENRLVGAVEMYKALLKHVKEENAAIVEKALLKYEWELFQARGEYARMKEAPYDALYKNAPLTQRLWISFKQYFPGLYCTYMKLRGREDGIPDKLRK